MHGKIEVTPPKNMPDNQIKHLIYMIKKDYKFVERDAKLLSDFYPGMELVVKR